MFYLCKVVLFDMCMVTYGRDTLGHWNELSTKFFPFLHDVLVLAGCFRIADSVASFVNTTANCIFALGVVTHQVPHTGRSVFNHSDFVGFHLFV